jgi:hypothetical protein
MEIRFGSGDLHVIDLRTRMPFRYGIATVTALPHLFLRLNVQVDGQSATGLAADHLPPKWFTKDPAKPIAVEIAEMLCVIEHALGLTAGLRAASPFDAWLALYEQQAQWGRAEGLAPLLTHFGVTLVERAMIEAVCRAAGCTFAQALRQNRFGIRLGALHPALAPYAPADLLPAQSLPAIVARHTVGLSDPIADEDIAPAERLDDGLPQSLASCITAYGLRHFKIKVNGAHAEDIARDVTRLGRMAEVIEQLAPASGAEDYAFSLDGNETFASADQLRAFWDAVQNSAKLRAFCAHLLFVEQPFHRNIALQAGTMRTVRDWPNRPPLIIDESDAEIGSLPAALALGYAGTSHKNCKGVFKGIANACLLAHLRREQPSQAFILSGEDLTNIGPVALQQDLAVQASLGIGSVERNGHHYFAGLSMFPPAVQQQVLAQHADLYHAGARGWPTLTVANGEIALGSVNSAPFGVAVDLDVDQFPALEQWRQSAQALATY